MLHQADDLFACGVHAPSSATLCDVIGIDDLIIVGIIAAASIAASQITASEGEDFAKDEATRQKQLQYKNAQLNHWSEEAQRGAAAAGLNPAYATGGRDAQQQKMNIDYGYDSQMRAASKQADMTRTQGYISAGSAIAQGIAGGALKPATSAAAGGLGQAFGDTGQDIAQRGANYDLNPQSSQLLGNGPAVSTPQLSTSDPNGGFQLQQSDYQLLGGAQPYSQGPFADDPFATASPYQNPGRYRFTL